MMPPKSVLETPQMVYHAIVPILPIKNSILFLFLLKMPATGKGFEQSRSPGAGKGKIHTYTQCCYSAIVGLCGSRFANAVPAG